MRRTVLYILVSSLFLLCFISSSAQQNNNLPPRRTCGTSVPDANWETWFSAKVKQQSTNKTLANYTIPVIIHILHNGDGIGSGENISQAQAQSQIAILNADYGGTNADITQVPTVFQSAKAGNTGIQFCLAKVDPGGVVLAEPGIERINWQERGWTNPNSFTSTTTLHNYFDDNIKPGSIWDPTKYLNVWLAQIDNSGLLGYASFPAGSGLSGLSGVETALTSGVVISQKAWGNIGTAANPPYNKGRTATHEIGHWLGLRHIWGDGSCSTDYCSDTPPAETANYGCMAHPFNAGGCSGNTTGEMFMNYMDYSDDNCLYMFTTAQATRMQTAMTNGTYRKPLANSTVCQSPAAQPNLSLQGFRVVPTSLNAGSTVTTSLVELNTGSLLSLPNYINYYISADDRLTPGLNGDLYLDQSFVNQNIGPASQTGIINKVVTIPANTGSGTFYIFADADGTSVINENNEADNTSFVAVTVTGTQNSNYCNGTTRLTATSGTISDGSGALNYASNLNCKWVIAPPGANQVTLNFSSFNIEPAFDTVLVYDGPDETYPLLFGWWGSSLPPAVTSSNGAICVKFVTDAEVTATGWTATYNSSGIIPACNEHTVLAASFGSFTDGSGTAAYGNNQACSWLIAPPCATSVKLNISQINTEAGYDGIIVYDGNNTDAPVLGVFSGTSIPAAITSSGGEMLVVFITDFSTTGQGFTAFYSSTGSSYCFEDITVNSNAYSGTISDGSAANNYCNNSTCRWLIQPPGATSVTLSFISFNTEADYDMVYVYDGPNDTYPLLGQFSGTIVPPSVTSTTGKLFIKFVSDEAVNESGWTANYNASTVYTFTGNGNWNNAANWLNNLVQPSTVPSGVEVIIDPATGGECIYTGTITFAQGAKLTIKQGKKLTVNGNLIMQQ